MERWRFNPMTIASPSPREQIRDQEKLRAISRRHH